MTIKMMKNVNFQVSGINQQPCGERLYNYVGDESNDPLCDEDDGLDCFGIGGDGLGEDDSIAGDGLSATGSSRLPSPTPRMSFAELKREFFQSQFNTVGTTVMFNNGTNEVVAHSLSNIVTVDISAGEDISCTEKFWTGVENCFLSMTCSRSIKQFDVYRNTITYFNMVDKWASRIFPLSFVSAIFLYYSLYTYILQTINIQKPFISF